MKKIVSFLALTTMLFSLTVNAFAINVAPERIPLNESFILFNGTGKYDPPEVIPRAVTKPTTKAPLSWYDVEHRWTAKKYTYTSYIFEPDIVSNNLQIFDALADQDFYMELYEADGTYVYTFTASYDQYEGKYHASLGHRSDTPRDYYMVIYNNSDTTISSGATYIVMNTPLSYTYSNESHLEDDAVLAETMSQRNRMENLAYIKKTEGEKFLISFDDGDSWEYYEDEEKLYFPFDGVYWWQRYNSKNGKKQISLDDRKTWYYLRFNEEKTISEISQDGETWICLPNVVSWTPIQPDDENIYRDNHRIRPN